jgi:hypothetical protein
MAPLTAQLAQIGPPGGGQEPARQGKHLLDALDADILREIIELLKARVATGAATFLVKVKAHRRDELADTLAEEARKAAKERREWSAAGRIGWCTNGRRERHKKISLDSGA